MTIKAVAALLKRRWVIVLSILLIVFGAASLILPQLRFYNERVQGQSFNRQYWQVHKPPKKPDSMDLGIPVKINLPRLGIHLNVVPGRYAPLTQEWYLDRVHAFYILPGTAPLKKTSVPLIYGHDIPAVFEDLDGMAPGEVMTIKNSKGATLTFRYIGQDVVTPNEGTILNAVKSDGKHINLLTCTGTWFMHRRVMHFKYVSTAPATPETSTTGSKA